MTPESISALLRCLASPMLSSQSISDPFSVISFIYVQAYKIQMFDHKLRTKGIIRTRFAELTALKGKKKSPNKRFSKSALRKVIENDDSVKSDLLSDQTKPSMIQLGQWEEPIWMHTYKECTSLLRSVEVLQSEMAKEQIKKMSAVDEKKHQRVIQQFVEQATGKLNICEKKLKQMDSAVKYQYQMSPAEKKNFTSMLMAMAITIRDQARKLRAQQQAQYHREQQLHRSTGINMNLTTIGDSETESWLSEQQFQNLQQSMIKQRDQEITKIVKSIYSLNSVYKQLQGLVIQQGSLLDRIDEHIDQTVQSVKKARQHLQQAKQKQDSVCINRCRRILAGLIILMLIILVVKHI